MLTLTLTWKISSLFPVASHLVSYLYAQLVTWKQVLITTCYEYYDRQTPNIVGQPEAIT